MSELAAAPEDVRAAYRLVLGREPDPVGYADYVASIHDAPLTTAQLLARFLTSAEFLKNRSGLQVDLGGISVVVDPSEPEFGQHIARNRIWEPHIVAIVKANLSPGQVFVDVGANVGVMSFAAALAVGRHGRVIAFEPDELNARFFLRGLHANRCQDFVRLYRFALSDRSEVFSLQGGSNTYLVEPNNQTRLVQAIRGDEILSNEPAVHFIKIDIEGHEPFAMEGLSLTLRKHKPLVLCEFNPRCLENHVGVSPADFAEQIFAVTYRVQAVEHDGACNQVSSPKALMDLWAAKNELAVRAGRLTDGMLHFDLLFRPST